MTPQERKQIFISRALAQGGEDEEQIIKEASEIWDKANYERNYSHTHCWDQNEPPACGQPIENHTQCCLCDCKPILRNMNTPDTKKYKQCSGAHCRCMNIDKQCQNFHHGDHSCPYENKQPIFNQPEKECSKFDCSLHNEGYGTPCNDNYQISKPSIDWIEEFDKKFPVDSFYGMILSEESDIKSFIAEKIEVAKYGSNIFEEGAMVGREQGRQEAASLITSLHVDDHLKYDPATDLRRGFVDGFKTAINVILKYF